MRFGHNDAKNMIAHCLRRSEIMETSDGEVNIVSVNAVEGVCEAAGCSSLVCIYY
jgi:hypothetical protein